MSNIIKATGAGIAQMTKREIKALALEYARLSSDEIGDYALARKVADAFGQAADALKPWALDLLEATETRHGVQVQAVGGGTTTRRPDSFGHCPKWQALQAEVQRAEALRNEWERLMIAANTHYLRTGQPFADADGFEVPRALELTQAPTLKATIL